MGGRRAVILENEMNWQNEIVLWKDSTESTRLEGHQVPSKSEFENFDCQSRASTNLSGEIYQWVSEIPSIRSL